MACFLLPQKLPDSGIEDILSTEQTSTSPPPTEITLPAHTKTLTPEAPLSITISNYQDFSPISQWDVGGDVTKITGIALSPDSNEIALLTLKYPEQGWLELRTTQDGKLLWNVNLGIKAAYNAVSFSPDGSLIGTGTEDGNVRIWNTENGNLLQTLTGHKFPVRVVAFSPDGTLIASGGSDNTARVWTVGSGKSKSTYQIMTSVRDIAFSPDSQYLAVTSNRIAVFDVTAGGDTPYIFYDTVGETRDLGEVAFSSNGFYLIAGGDWYNVENNRWRKRILVWDFPYNTSNPLRIPIDDAIEDVVISPDSQLLLGVYKDKGKLLVIEIAEREIIGSIEIGPKLYMTYLPDTSMFAVVSTKKSVTIWDVSP